MSDSTKTVNLIQLGSELWLKPGYGGVSLVRRDAHGHILIGIFTDRLREYATDWDMPEVIAALNEHEATKRASEYKAGYDAGRKSWEAS